jgi:hypothetical protein
MPSHRLVEAFMVALRYTGLESLKNICAVDLAVEMVADAESSVSPEDYQQ